MEALSATDIEQQYFSQNQIGNLKIPVYVLDLFVSIALPRFSLLHHRYYHNILHIFKIIWTDKSSYFLFDYPYIYEGWSKITRNPRQSFNNTYYTSMKKRQQRTEVIRFLWKSYILRLNVFVFSCIYFS